ncbi:MAG: TlpA family protein disulfide reductase [Methylococcales bacterium]
MTLAVLGEPAPPLSVSTWVQGDPCNFADLIGKVVLVEVFQVNCPGCFLYALPQAIDLYQRYVDQGLVVLGVATAFEDFDKNNLKNLQSLSEQNQVPGETYRVLQAQGQLKNSRLPFHIPFPLAMDNLRNSEQTSTAEHIAQFINDRVPDFAQQAHDVQQSITRQARQYLGSLSYYAETFNRFNMQGTPSHLLVDKQGLLRESRFGYFPDLEADIASLLRD